MKGVVLKKQRFFVIVGFALFTRRLLFLPAAVSLIHKCTHCLNMSFIKGFGIFPCFMKRYSNRALVHFTHHNIGNVTAD